MNDLAGYHVAYLQDLQLLELLHKSQHRRTAPPPGLDKLGYVDVHLRRRLLGLLIADEQILQGLQAGESVGIAIRIVVAKISHEL